MLRYFLPSYRTPLRFRTKTALFALTFCLFNPLHCSFTWGKAGTLSLGKAQAKAKPRQVGGKYPKPHYLLELGKEEGLPMFIIANVALAKYQFKSNFPWCLHIIIAAEEKNRARLPTSQETKVLNALEDQISASLDKTCHYHFLGHTSWNGLREIYYYLDEPEKAHKALQTFTSAKHPMRPMEYKIEEDQSWHNVDFLFDYQRPSKHK